MCGLLNDRRFSISSPKYQLQCFLCDKSKLLYMPLSFFFFLVWVFYFTIKSSPQKARHVRQRFRIHFSCVSTIGSRSGYLTYSFFFRVSLTSFRYHCAECGCGQKQCWGLSNQLHQCVSWQNKMTI